MPSDEQLFQRITGKTSGGKQDDAATVLLIAIMRHIETQGGGHPLDLAQPVYQAMAAESAEAFGSPSERASNRRLPLAGHLSALYLQERITAAEPLLTEPVQKVIGAVWSPGRTDRLERVVHATCALHRAVVQLQPTAEHEALRLLAAYSGGSPFAVHLRLCREAAVPSRLEPDQYQDRRAGLGRALARVLRAHAGPNAPAEGLDGGDADQIDTEFFDMQTA